MLDNQPQTGRRREVRRLDFFRPDQIVVLVTHQAIPIEQLPDVDLRAWVAKLGSNIDQVPGFAEKRASEFVAALCEQLNNDEHLPETTLTDWTGHLKGQLEAEGWELVDPQPRSYSFPPIDSHGIDDVPSEGPQLVIPNGGAFSIVVCNVKRLKKSGNLGAASIINLMDVANSEIHLMDVADGNDDDQEESTETNAKRVRTKRRLFNLISILDQPGKREMLNFAGLTVEAVFPNWVASSGKSDTGGTGGPGSEPVPYAGSFEKAPYEFNQLKVDLTTANLYGTGENVDVVILDTAPSGDDLVFAYKELVLKKLESQKQPHPILQSLLGTEGLLNLYPATFEERRRMGNTSLNHHGYKMSDHGLFIAGIINSIVPRATIHVIEVLNQFGVGDIETIASGFAKAYAIYRRKKRHVVVNCSLCLDLPDIAVEFPYRAGDDEIIEAIDRQFEKDLRKKLKDELEKVKPKDKELKDIPDDLRWVIGLRAICERLDEVKGQVVAAAGNDSEKKADGQRNSQSARYPAAFSKVIGVGALPKDAKSGPNGKYDASSFSNLADKPAQTGIMALGGEPGEEKGVLGLYLGEFPLENTDDGQTTLKNGWALVPSTNTNAWAWWAGTSFATPILTATIASVLSRPASSPTTQSPLGQLYTAKVILEALTSETEDGMPSSVYQGVKQPS